MFLLPANVKRIGSKATEKTWRHNFPNYKSIGAFCYHGNQRLDSICPKKVYSLSFLPLMMLHIKFDQDLPTDFRDTQIQKPDVFVTQGQITPK